MRKYWLTAILAVVSLALVSSSANATNLPPGSTVTPSADTIDLTTATVINDTGTQSFSGSGVTGNFREEVVQEASGGNSLGGYTFVYQISVTSGEISRMSQGAWGSTAISIDAGTAIGTATNSLLGAAGTQNATDATLNTSGVVAFDFTSAGLGQITAPGVSYLLILRTNTNVDPAQQAELINSSAFNLNGYAPGVNAQSIVPEPSSLAIAGLGALGMIGYGLRRKAQGA